MQNNNSECLFCNGAGVIDALCGQDEVQFGCWECKGTGRVTRATLAMQTECTEAMSNEIAKFGGSPK